MGTETEQKVKQKGKQKGKQNGTMSFLDHLDELRTRLIRFFIVLALCVLAAYFYRKEILDLIRKPVDIPLKKYTAVTQAPATDANGQSNLSSLGAYNCVCREASSLAGQPAEIPEVTPVVSAAAAGNAASASKTVSTSAGTMDSAGRILHKIGATLDDFIMFFQVMLNKEPSPVFTDRPLPDKGKDLVSKNNVGPSGTINLNCQCSVSAPAPVASSTMVYIGLPEQIFAQMKVAIFAGFFISCPYLLIELWGFIGPALYAGEKKVFWIFSIFTYLFFIGGALFGYFVVFPFGFDFFLSLTQLGEIMPSLSIGEYLGFSIKLLLAFGFIFEMPLATFILARMGILTPKIMISQARVAILVVFILSAVLTPPDPFTMMLMAGPLLLLYLLSIGVCFVGLNRQKAALREQGLDQDDE
ncbi:MAG: twin-arginine translocase subunit TatC [bacterium]